MNFGLRCGFVVDIIIYDACDGYCDVYDACYDIYDAVMDIVIYICHVYVFWRGARQIDPKWLPQQEICRAPGATHDKLTILCRAPHH
jgi:hypothetical protein